MRGTTGEGRECRTFATAGDTFTGARITSSEGFEPMMAW
jgi:hypothetical protein